MIGVKMSGLKLCERNSIEIDRGKLDWKLGIFNVSISSCVFLGTEILTFWTVVVILTVMLPGL